MTPDSIREMNEEFLKSCSDEEIEKMPVFSSNRKEEDTSFWPTNKRANSAFDEDPRATEAISLGK